MARTRNLKPTEGARFVLERQVDATPNDGAMDIEGTAADLSVAPMTDSLISEPMTSATYRVSIHTPDAEFSTTATLAEDGTVELAGSTGAPGDLDKRLENIAKLVARDAPKRREDGLVVWPVRIMRWRK